MRGRDLSKSLDEKEVRRLRTLLSDNPQIAEAPEAGGDFPQMYFHPDYLAVDRELRTNADPIAKKIQREKMKMLCRVAWDEEEASELIDDGWKASPADHLSPEKDPRIPRGTEGRRAAIQKRLGVKEELLRLRHRLAELEGIERAMSADPAEPGKVPTGKLHIPPPKKPKGQSLSA